MKHAERPANEIPIFYRIFRQVVAPKRKQKMGNLCELSGRGELTQLTT